jgi:subfamily B ATP-binding cassette protein MsbA
MLDSLSLTVETPRQTVAGIWRRAKLPLSVLSSITLLSILTAFVDLLGIGMLLPFLDAFVGSGLGSKLASSPLGFILPLFSGLSPTTTMRTVAVLILVVHFVKFLMTYATTQVSHSFMALAEANIRRTVFTTVLFMDFRLFSRSKVSDLTALVNGFSASAASFLFALVSMIPTVVLMMMHVGIVILISWELSLVGVVLFFVSSFVHRFFNRQTRVISADLSSSNLTINHTDLESITGLQTIRAFAREPQILARFEGNLGNYHNQLRRKKSNEALSGSLHGYVTTLSLGIVLIIGTFVFDVDGKVWSEMILLFMVVMARLSGPINAFQRLKSQLSAHQYATQVVLAFLKEAENGLMEDGHRSFNRLSDSIILKNVTFRYQPHGKAEISDVNLEIKAGQTIGIVGASGCGKSTLLKLLMRFFDPTEGKVLVDGVDLREFRLSEWRHSVGLVSQATFLFNDTIASNLRFAKPDASDAEIEEAAKQAFAHDFIIAMPDGYQTCVGDRGVRLSGGEAQRIAIARALLANPPILFLDEATSSLDAEAEQTVQKALTNLSRNRTVVVVAHRLSTIQSADRIVVVEAGRLVESGTYDELMSAGGVFARYVNLQQLR